MRTNRFAFMLPSSSHGVPMTKLRLVAFSAFGLLLASSSLLGACSDGDDPVAPADDGGARDSQSTDVNVPPGDDDDTDGSTPDGGTDGEVTDGGFDAGLTVETFAQAVATNLCTSIATCCFGGVPADGGTVDGGTYDPTECLNLNRALGFESSNLGVATSSTVSFGLDQAKAVECLDKVANLKSKCSLTGSDLRDARTACFNAFVGKLQPGQACNSSVECIKDTYCKPNNPASPFGSPGKCTALAGANGNCGGAYVSNPQDDNVDQQYAEEACSYRSGGENGLHCSSYDYDEGDYRDRADWKCVTGVANGQGCSNTTWCATGICDPSDYTCHDPLQLLGQFCGQLIKD